MKNESMKDYLTWAFAIIAVMAVALLGAVVGGAILGVFVKTMLWVAA
jgi:uncharacterized integral membrane protein